MNETEINGQTYQFGRLNARKQFHIARRLLPFVSHLVPLMRGEPQALVAGADGALVPDLRQALFFHGLAALSETIRELSDADADYVLDGCLEAVRWRQGDRWVPLVAPGGAVMLQAATDNMALQLRLAWEVLAANLSSFSLETLLPMGLAQPNGMDRSEAAAAAAA